MVNYLTWLNPWIVPAVNLLLFVTLSFLAGGLIAFGYLAITDSKWTQHPDLNELQKAHKDETLERFRERHRGTHHSKKIIGKAQSGSHLKK